MDRGIPRSDRVVMHSTMMIVQTVHSMRHTHPFISIIVSIIVTLHEGRFMSDSESAISSVNLCRKTTMFRQINLSLSPFAPAYKLGLIN